MTPEQKADFVKLLSGLRRPGRDRFGGRLYELVRLDDGSITFVRSALQAEIEQALAQAMDEIYGPDPEPAEDDLLLP